MFGKLIMTAFPRLGGKERYPAATVASLHTFYEELNKEGVIFCFNGPASQSVVEGVGEALRMRMDLEDAGMTTTRRVFAIFVEQIQNVINYSSERRPVRPGNGNGLSFGVIVVGREGEKYYVMCGNRVEAAKGDHLAQKVQQIRNMDKEALKAFYKEQRRRQPAEGSKGAGLGIIEMARHSTEPLDFSIVSLTAQESFFTIKATS